MHVESVADIARVHGAERPDSVAILFGDRRLTYGQLDERSNRVANALAAEGVQPQERVAFLDKNVPEFFEVVFGATKLNAVLCAVNWRLAPPEAAYIVNDAEAKVLVVGQDLLPMLDAMASELTTVKKFVVVGDGGTHESYETWLERHDSTDPNVAAGPDDVAFQFYSSGTTGLPKGVMLTNANCFSNVEANNDLLGFDADSVCHVVMPLFHVAGGFWGILGLYNGIPNVLMHEVDPAQILRDIQEHRVTHTVMVPAVIQFVLMLPETADADFGSLELIVYGASPISEDVLRRAIEVFGCDFVQAYGLTETAGGCVILPADDHDPDGPNSHRLRAAGKAASNTEVKVVDAETLEEVPAGTVGEILVRSPQNMIGYWKMPEATADTILPDGFLRTGDGGYLDEDGYVYIHDRIKDMIISGGENVYPAEVENALMSHPGIADVAVIGVPSDRWGETPKAIVVAAPGAELDEAEIIAFAKSRLAGYKCPTSVDFIDTLPRNPSGKILKKDLRAPYWEGRERQVH
ncbi:MAG: fatty acid--CoA ligase [Actinobacteria bacterium]|nr:fatty acid--CoA ligase [Actinomycetota bacterium]MBV9254044.1 fatty acid--CoA ligase [Actinomycetota bacterium]